MARPRSFAPDDILDRAVAVFWARGFAATSIRDLVGATGLERGSLYAAFGDKLGLFEAALQRYALVVSSRTFATLDDPDADLNAIEAVLRALAEPAPAAPPGCFVTNTAVELGPHDDALREVVAGLLQRLEARLMPALERACARGQLRADLAIADAAALLVTVAQGLRVLARAGIPPERRLAAVRTAIAQLRPQP